MQIPLQITFRHLESSPALESRIRTLAARLEKFSEQILSCRVVIESLHHHQRQGEVFDVTIHVTVPGREIAIRRAHAMDPSHQDAYVALRDAFRATRRQLQDYERERRQDVKAHTALPSGWICELHPDQHFGRIRTGDGRLIYFHANSVQGRAFEKLTTGTEVHFAEEAGNDGPQASTVHVPRKQLNY
jgi:ribosome-associated translation inhibitor RaiA/cold shock CspA family protein